MDVMDLPEAGDGNDALFSNIDHTFTDAVLKAVEAGGCRGQHAAWDYCGWVWKDEQGWHEAIYRYGSLMETLHDVNARAVINRALEKWGRL